MSDFLTVLVEGTQANGKPVNINVYEMSAQELLGHLKQMVRSVARTGIVHEIEDRKNPFTGIAIDHIEIFRTEDAEGDYDEDYDEEDDEEDGEDNEEEEDDDF